MLATTVGKSRSHIGNLVRMLGLPEEVKDLLSQRRADNAGHARALVEVHPIPWSWLARLSSSADSMCVRPNKSAAMRKAAMKRIGTDFTHPR